jgi:DNA polymerase III gamma/tau subunit
METFLIEDEFQEQMQDLNQQSTQIQTSAQMQIIYYIMLYFFIFTFFQPSIRIFVYYLLKKLVKTFQNQETQEDPKPTPEEPKTIQKPEDKYLEIYLKMESTPLTQERLEALKNTFLFENTQMGNLLMFYDYTRESFIYYADNTIPYRFLEAASRHYVVQNNCKAIHINMQEELTEAEKRLAEKKQQEEQQKLQQEQQEQNQNQNQNQQDQDQQTTDNKPKKNVFAKLKNYNTSSMRAPNQVKPNANATNPTHRPPPTTKVSEKTDIIVKEKANRYSCEGKMANFSFIKKVDKKLVDKRQALSFAEFKKMQQK